MGVGLPEGVNVVVCVGVAVALGDGVAEGDEVGVAVGLAVDVGVDEAEGELVGVALGVREAVVGTRNTLGLNFFEMNFFMQMKTNSFII